MVQLNSLHTEDFQTVQKHIVCWFHTYQATSARLLRCCSNSLFIWNWQTQYWLAYWYWTNNFSSHFVKTNQCMGKASGVYSFQYSTSSCLLKAAMARQKPAGTMNKSSCNQIMFICYYRYPCVILELQLLTTMTKSQKKMTFIHNLSRNTPTCIVWSCEHSTSQSRTCCLYCVSIASWHPLPPTSSELQHAGCSNVNTRADLSSEETLAGSLSSVMAGCVGAGLSPPGRLIKQSCHSFSSVVAAKQWLP